MVSATLCLRDGSFWQDSLPPSRLDLLVVWQVAGISTDGHVWTVEGNVCACVFLFDIQTRLLQGLDQLLVIKISEWTCEEMRAKLWVSTALIITSTKEINT